MEKFAETVMAKTMGDMGNVSMYDISMYGTDRRNLTRKERMRRQARKMIKAGLREDQCYCCSLEGSPTTACLIIAGIILLIIACLMMFAIMSAGVDFEATFAEPGMNF
uniref:Col_cuticle_N domain-containing protein n=1 Tax=Elaeophora elaphi TaxID=1147741 RepID=A0A0R3RQF0_9BILA